MMEVGLVSDLQLCFVSSNQRVTVGTPVGGILETVHTERYPGHQTAADCTEDTSSDPRHCPSLHADRGGHQGLWSLCWWRSILSSIVLRRKRRRSFIPVSTLIVIGITRLSS